MGGNQRNILQILKGDWTSTIIIAGMYFGKQLIDRGNTSDCAIDQMMTVYGQSKSVTVVINAMKSDRSQRIERF